MKRVLICILIITCFLATCVGCSRSTETRIIEVENVEVLVPDYPVVGTINNERFFIISNPPEDISELRQLLEEYIDENWDVNRLELNGNKADVCWRFYRESHRLPLNWQPSHGYMSKDYLMPHHNDDLIAITYWDESGAVKTYTIYQLSKEKQDYGKKLEKRRYENDELISTEYNPDY